MSQKKKNVRVFWPEERVAALLAYVRGEAMTDDNFERSQMGAWCREYIAASASWLQSDAARLHLKVKVQDAMAKIQEAKSSIESLNNALEDMKPLESAFQDRWASRIVNAPDEPPVPAERPPMDPDKPAGEEKIPAPEQKLPGEVAFDLAHGKPGTGKTEIRLSEKLAKMKPDALKRCGIPLKETEEEYLKRVGLAAYPQAETENFEDERMVAPNPDDVPPEETDVERVRPTLNIENFSEEAKREVALANDEEPPKSESTVAERAPKDAPTDSPAKDDDDEWVTVKRADGQVMRRRKRTGFRMELEKVAKEHGDEVATYLVHNILHDKVSTQKIRDTMRKLGGTNATVDMARQRCAMKLGKDAEFSDGSFVFTDHAHVYEHKDGLCSWWLK